jgi:hypothetical protein
VIQKVSNPIRLTLIRGTKNTENNLGAGSGSGMSYEQSHENQPPPESQDLETKEDNKVSELKKNGMTAVVLSFLENKLVEQSQHQVGLTAKYQADSSQTKGLLLNKKAE